MTIVNCLNKIYECPNVSPYNFMHFNIKFITICVSHISCFAFFFHIHFFSVFFSVHLNSLYGFLVDSWVGNSMCGFYGRFAGRNNSNWNLLHNLSPGQNVYSDGEGEYGDRSLSVRLTRSCFPRFCMRHIEIYVNLKSKVVVSIIKLNYRASICHTANCGDSQWRRRGNMTTVIRQLNNSIEKSFWGAFLRVSSLRRSRTRDHPRTPYDLIAGNSTCPADHHQNMPLLFCSLIASQSSWLHSQKPKDHFFIFYFFFFWLEISPSWPLRHLSGLDFSEWHLVDAVGCLFTHSLIHSPTLTACYEYQVRSNALHTPIPQLVVREGAKIEALEDQRQIAMVICRCPTTSG